MYFDDAARIWDNQSRCERAQVLASAIREAWGGAPNAVLDFGCGTGLLTFALCPYAAAIYGYDSSVGMREVFASKLELYQVQNVRFLTEEEMKGHTFDVIFTSMVFHHIPDITAELTGLRRLLAPDGRLILIDLDKEDGSFHRNDPGFNGHNGFDRDEMRRVLESCGFHEVSIQTVYQGIRSVEGSDTEYSLFMAMARR